MQFDVRDPSSAGSTIGPMSNIKTRAQTIAEGASGMNEGEGEVVGGLERAEGFLKQVPRDVSRGIYNFYHGENQTAGYVPPDGQYAAPVGTAGQQVDLVRE